MYPSFLSRSGGPGRRNPALRSCTIDHKQFDLMPSSLKMLEDAGVLFSYYASYH